MSVPQNAGSSTIVAIVIAFHFCCGDSGAIPGRAPRPLHPFTEPGGEAAHEVPLQREEHDEREQHRDERGRR